VTPLQDVPLTVPKFFTSPRQETRSATFSFRDSSPVIVGVPKHLSGLGNRTIILPGEREKPSLGWSVAADEYRFAALCVTQFAATLDLFPSVLDFEFAAVLRPHRSIGLFHSSRIGDWATAPVD
jgi:hypothetical protein